MDFLTKLKELLMGAQKQPAAPSPDQGQPWNDPSLQAPPPMPMPSPSPSPTPMMTPSDEAIKLAMRLQQQREMAKRFLPEEVWNTPRR